MRLLRRPSGWIDWARDGLIAAGCVLVGFLARLVIDTLIPGQVPFVTFYPAVMAASLIAGYRTGLITVVLSTPLALVAFTDEAGVPVVATTLSSVVVNRVGGLAAGEVALVATSGDGDGDSAL